MKRAYLFDMDGVVLDSMPYHVRAWQEAFSEFGLEVPERLLYLYEGAIEPHTATRLFTKNGCKITISDFEAILRRQKEIFKAKYRSRVKPFPEIPILLERLNQMGLYAALVTSSHSDVLGSILPMELLLKFKCIVTGDNVPRRKPNPDPYLKAISDLGANSGACVAIENAPAGIEAAKRAGIRCIAVKTTLGDEDLKGADLIVNDHQELMDVL